MNGPLAFFVRDMVGLIQNHSPHFNEQSKNKTQNTKHKQTGGRELRGSTCGNVFSSKPRVHAALDRVRVRVRNLTNQMTGTLRLWFLTIPHDQ